MDTLNQKLTTIANNLRTIMATSNSLTLDDMADITNMNAQDKTALITTLQGFGIDITQQASLGEAVAKTSTLQVGGSSSGGMDSFWDVYQNNGSRTEYSYAFYGSQYASDGGWTDENFTPKYVISPTTCQSMFEKCSITSIDMTKVDFSEVADFPVVFRNAQKLTSVEMSVPMASSMNQTFRGVSTLENLLIVNLPADCTFSNTFTGCTNLTNLQIYGTIGQNGFNVSPCTKLTAQTITDHILSNLEDKTSVGGTWTCTLGTTNLNKLSNEQKAIATQKGWTLA